MSPGSLLEASLIFFPTQAECSQGLSFMGLSSPGARKQRQCHPGESRPASESW